MHAAQSFEGITQNFMRGLNGAGNIRLRLGALGKKSLNANKR